MSTFRRAMILAQVAVIAAAWSVPVGAKPAAQKQLMKPVLQAIDPSQAQEAPVENEQPAAPQGQQPAQNLEQMIPQFGKPDPVVPPSMTAPMPPGPGWGSGYAPPQQQPSRPPMDTLQASGAPDDPRLARLEQAAFGSTYPEHDADDRVEHLEREVFSTVFQGDMESRIQRLQAKLNPQGAFGAPPGRPPAYTPPMQPTTAYRPQPAAYQPSNWQPPPQQMPPQVPQQAPPQQMPPQQQYYQPQQFQPPMQQQSPGSYSGMPPGIPQQPYQGAYQRPQLPFPPGAAAPPTSMAPPTVPNSSAPPSIPQGPVTMSSFNRPPQQQPPQMPQGPPGMAALPPQQQQQPQQVNPYAGVPSTGAPPATAAGGSNMSAALDNMPYDKKVGDYSAKIMRLGGSFPRWTSLPVRVHIPMNTPESWRAPIEGAVKKWAQYLPTVIAPPSEPADVEVGWINHLAPRQLGITNLEIFNGHPRVTVYLLRPSYYPPDANESMLPRIALHHIGHALGLFGESDNAGDAMFKLDSPIKAGIPKTPTVSQRDVNTLRRVYEASPLPEGFQSGQPISWP